MSLGNISRENLSRCCRIDRVSQHRQSGRWTTRLWSRDTTSKFVRLILEQWVLDPRLPSQVQGATYTASSMIPSSSGLLARIFLSILKRRPRPSHQRRTLSWPPRMTKTNTEPRSYPSVLMIPILFLTLPLRPRTSKSMTGADVRAIRRRHTRAHRETSALKALLPPPLRKITPTIASAQAQRHPHRAPTCTLHPRHHLHVRAPRPLPPRRCLQVQALLDPVPGRLTQVIIPMVPSSNLRDPVYSRSRCMWDLGRDGLFPHNLREDGSDV